MYAAFSPTTVVLVASTLALTASPLVPEATVTASVEIQKRQLGPLTAHAECFPAFDYAAVEYQIYGAVSTVLCATERDFIPAYVAATECEISCLVTKDCTGALALVTKLDVPRSICNLPAVLEVPASSTSRSTSRSTGLSTKTTIVSGTSSVLVLTSTSVSSSSDDKSSILNSLSSSFYSCLSVLNGSSSTASNFIACGSALILVRTSANQTSTASATSALASSPTSPAANKGLGTGAVAGVAVGAAAGTFLMLGAIAFFIFRHRKQAKQRKSTNIPTDEHQTAEKAQLDSTEHRPHREELEGSRGTRKIRQVGGLNEMGDSPLLGRVTSEMSANEIAATEMSSSLSPTTNRSSTLVDSSTRDSGSRY